MGHFCQVSKWIALWLSGWERDGTQTIWEKYKLLFAGTLPAHLSLSLSFSVREEEEEEEENGHQIQMNFVSPLKNKRTKEPRGRCGWDGPHPPVSPREEGLKGKGMGPPEKERKEETSCTTSQDLD